MPRLGIKNLLLAAVLLVLIAGNVVNQVVVMAFFDSRSSYRGIINCFVPANLEDNNKTKTTNEEDTAIIISSSWIPSHPSTYMIETVINSTLHLKGLPSSTQIIITVDYPPNPKDNNITKERIERIDKLEEYTVRLFNLYLSNPRVHIIPAMKNLHIAGSVLKAIRLLDLHYPAMKYLYYLQHDFKFIKEIDHTALVNLMDVNSKVNWVLFPNRPPSHMKQGCGTEESINYNITTTMADNIDDSNAQQGESQNDMRTMTLFPTGGYSDNNHLTRFHWYKELIISLIYYTRPPEFPLQRRANDWCLRNESLGLYLYHEHAIEHIDGAGSSSVPT